MNVYKALGSAWHKMCTIWVFLVTIIALLLFEERSIPCKLMFFIKSYETLLSSLFEEQNNLNTHNALVTLQAIQRLLWFTPPSVDPLINIVWNIQNSNKTTSLLKYFIA